MENRENLIKEKTGYLFYEQADETVKIVKSDGIAEKFKFGTGTRHNDGKLRYDLINPDAERDMVKVLTEGAKEYAPRNWEMGMNWTTVIGSLKRHLAAIERGEDYDPKTGLLHAAHLQCNAHFINAYYYIYPQGDDRPRKYLRTPKIGLDVDEVLANWVNAWITKFNMQVPKSWYFDRKIKQRFEELKNAGELDEFYLSIKPLTPPEEIPFEPHCYITSRPVTKEVTEQWLDNHNFPSKPVYSVDVRHTKVDIAKEAGVEIFIDDSFDNFVDLNNNGIFTYLYTATWNLKHDVGHMRLNSLKDLPLLK